MISYETRIGKITLSNSYFSKLIGRAVTSCFGVVGMVPRGSKQRLLGFVSKKDRLDTGVVVRGDFSSITVSANVDRKLKALKDLLSSSEDRFIIFYNFNHEGNKILEICGELEKPLSLVNGNVKDLTKYENESNSVTLIQYQAGAMGLNLQKANKIIYFTPCLFSELFEQSKKRTHRIGQEKPCFYYQLICNNSVEEKIYATLALRKDFTEKLFEKEMSNG